MDRRECHRKRFLTNHPPLRDKSFNLFSKSPFSIKNFAFSSAGFYLLRILVIFGEVPRGLFGVSGIGMLARGREGIGGISYGSLARFSPST
ncbi:hypothetical protein DRO64_01370 [Candidatus Bathyarchaeota archaeon]|nr:MAG: hypothetical protein DRO64_01370 [Candidatus Bathyarchaeota archaeon]